MADDQLQLYSEAAWNAYSDKLGRDRIMSPAEWAIMRGWYSSRIPLRIVLRAFQDVTGRGITLGYYERPVREAYARWRQSLSA